VKAQKVYKLTGDLIFILNPRFLNLKGIEIRITFPGFALGGEYKVITFDLLQ